MKTFNTEEYREVLDKMGINHTTDSNPSPERVEKIKKIMEARDARLKQLVEDYRSGKLEVPKV